MGALFAPHHWSQQLKPGAIGQGHHPIDHLVDGLGGNAAIAVGAVGVPRPPIQQTQVVVDFRHRAHRRAGVVGGRFLVDGNGRAQPLDGIHIGLIHLAQKLPGIGTEGFYVAALSLGKNGIEGQGRFTRPRHPCKHNQLVAGQLQVNIFEVVLPGSPNANDIVVNGGMVVDQPIATGLARPLLDCTRLLTRRRSFLRSSVRLGHILGA
jgi:hypothetical protein